MRKFKQKPIVLLILLAASLVLGFFTTTGPCSALAADDCSCSKNFEEVGHSDLSMDESMKSYSKVSPWPRSDGDYIYSGCYPPHRCFTIVSIKDKANPKRIATVYPYDPVKSPLPPPGDPRWAEEKPVEGWDPGWNTQTHYVAYHSNILVVNQEAYRYGSKYQDHYSGIKVYDVSDRKNPKYLSYFKVKGNGVHHLL